MNKVSRTSRSKLLAFGASLMLGVSTLATAPAWAAGLVIGSSTEPSAVDPLFSRTGNNQNLAMQVFDRLVVQDENLQLHPGIAKSWETTGPMTWLVHLRDDVTFHDGNKLTADDIIYSLDRAKNVPNSPAPFTGNVAAIDSMKALDPYTIEFTTKAPTPDFIEQIGLVYMLEKKVAEGASIEDYNSGKAAVGTGPYKFKEWVPGDHVTLVRNDAYWDKKAAYDTVTIKFISNDAARVAALLSGSVQLIDAVSPVDVTKLSGTAGIKVHSTSSTRIIYMALDSSRDTSPFITDLDGKPLTPNPLKNAKVRLALSKLINRDGIVDRILSGAGQTAGQLVPEGIGGYVPDLKAESYDVDGAKKLLADAGYPKGFGITIHSSNDRFPGDGEVAQAIGQMFARGGLKVNGVVTQPYNVYASAAGKQEFSAFIFSLGNTTPTAITGLRNLLMTKNKEAGTGGFNRVQYSNPVFDNLMQDVLTEFDTNTRMTAVQNATRTVMQDTPFLPLYWQKVYWASKDDVTYIANKSEDTSAYFASPAK
ncbi:ABC transporter substrate-binding protein [Radicibacter daui]|uniref:ABC transporter substrate-binding protein n=1 Tax=Radicibacter daui TaxID=3064829 RepID=UPI004046D6B1